jgi:hypothetical protein
MREAVPVNNDGSVWTIVEVNICQPAISPGLATTGAAEASGFNNSRTSRNKSTVSFTVLKGLDSESFP